MGKQEGIKSYYLQKIEEAEVLFREKQLNLRRLEAQRNELNTKGSYSETQSYPLSSYAQRGVAVTSRTWFLRW